MKVIKNIIFSGGAFKGWAYIGAIKALNENIPFDKIEQIIGVSIGAIFGLFYILQIDPTFLINFLLRLDFKKIIDIDLNSLISNQSLFEGKYLKKLLIDITKLNENITFKELYLQNKILFTTCAFNTSNAKIEYFNNNLTPDIKIIDALMASCALPFLFPAYNINNNWYYDGGICNNCPCNLLIDTETSLIFDIANHNRQSNYNICNLVISLSKLLNINFNKTNNFKIYNIIDDLKFENESFNLNQSKDTIFNIYMVGYKNTQKIFKD